MMYIFLQLVQGVQNFNSEVKTILSYVFFGK